VVGGNRLHRSPQSGTLGAMSIAQARSPRSHMSPPEAKLWILLRADRSDVRIFVGRCL